ncbi:MAG: formamidopyrimidine-DNA glycosylase [Deltaproteobacteria bacterium]|nr:MAG: formamidopyrimidine-DNA glycosylase [Deltaproteobacteria bacterium]
MPELPDVTVYVESIASRVAGQPIEGIRVASPFVVRTFEPPLSAASGKRVLELRRLGKRIVFVLEGGLFLVIHLMIAGRLHWKAPGARAAGKQALAAFEFESGTLVLTEAGTKRRAAIHLVQGEWALGEHDAGGIDVFAADPAAFRAALERENQRLFSGIGNAYSDEILHRAKLSPALLTQKMSPADVHALFESTRAVLTQWTERLREEARQKFPEKVTAFRHDFAVHGRYRQPCPVCGTAIQRIAYADNETNYCPRCQTAGRLLSDRSLARLLHDDWPRTIEELEEKGILKGNRA